MRTGYFSLRANNAVTTKMQADSDREAQHAAAHASSTEGRIDKTARPKNWLDLNR